MIELNVRELLVSCLAEVLGSGEEFELGDTVALLTVIDSLQFVRFSGLLEQRLHIEFTVDELSEPKNWETIKTIIAMIDARTGSDPELG